MSNVGLKPFCITCANFKNCQDVPLAETPEEVSQFEKMFEETVNEDSNTFSELEEPQEAAELPTPNRVESILETFPILKVSLAMMETIFPPAILKSLKEIPADKPSPEHHLGVSNFETIIGETVIRDFFINKEIFKSSGLKKLKDVLGADILISSLHEMLMRILTKKPELLVTEILAPKSPFAFPGGKK